jgi:hypothetical protein
VPGKFGQIGGDVIGGHIGIQRIQRGVDQPMVVTASALVIAMSPQPNPGQPGS